MRAGRNSLVLITVDCLRADHVGFLGYERLTTPFLDSLAPHSVVFSNAIVSGAPTYFSFPAIMASRHPLALGRDVIGIAPGETTLAKVLQDEGYGTAAFLAANPYLSSRFGYDAGFDTFLDYLDKELDPLTTGAQEAQTSRFGKLNQRLSSLAHKNSITSAVYDEMYFEYCQRVASAPAESLDRLRRFPSADVIVDAACAWLATQGDKPSFLWLHLMDAHSPYYPQEKALQQMGCDAVTASQARYTNSYWNRGDLGPARLKSHVQDVVTLYDAGIRWVDSQIARLVESLQRLNRWDQCVLAMTADHGEEFLDHSGRFHPPEKLNEELIRVPLLLHTLQATAQTRVDSPFSLMSLAPTLLDCMEIPCPGNFLGSSSWSQIVRSDSWDDAAIVECISGCNNPFDAESRMGSRVVAVRGPRFKLVIDFASKESLFDLQDDPGELHALPEHSEKAVRRTLLEIARTHVVDSIKSRDAHLRLSARVRDLQRQWSNSASRASA
jgi:arylsulfatase A-like enzyme